ncbi:MAG TPA: hypothetical protein VJU16_08090 [Planctomycetota bacterium]|nr:hypothetical protein [Planctomycetota bacterium]
MNLVEGVKKGDPLSVSRAISAVENGTAEARSLLDALSPLVGRAVRVGFTGPPGVGKSTAIDSLVQVLRARSERVGVGQSEIEIARATDVTVVILTPESGDGIQAMKSGIMEIADVILINKADRPGGDQLERDLRGAFDLRPNRRAKDIPILHAEAFRGKGIPELIGAVDAYIAARRSDGGLEARRSANMVRRLRNLVEYMIERNLWEEDGAAGRLESLAREVLNHSKSSYQAAEHLVREALRGR